MDPLIWAPLVVLAVLAGVTLSLCWAYYCCLRGRYIHTIVTQVMIFNAQLSQSARMILKEVLPTGLIQRSKPGVETPGGICRQLQLFLVLLFLHLQLFLVLLSLHLQLLRLNPRLAKSTPTRGFLTKRSNFPGLSMKGHGLLGLLRLANPQQQFPQLQLMMVLMVAFLTKPYPPIWTSTLGRKTETLLQSSFCLC